MTFTHFNLHTEFSLVDGIIRIKPLFSALKEMGMTAVALTDLGNEFGAIKFYKTAMQSGIKPIFGSDCLLAEGNDDLGKITIIAQNYTGYLNLAELLSYGYRSHQIRGVPHITYEKLQEYADGLIVIVAKESPVGRALLNQGTESATALLKQHFSAFLPDRLYIGLKRLGQENDERFITEVLPIAESLQLPVIAINDVRFMQESDFDAHEIRTCIQSGHTMLDPNRPKNYSPQQYLRSIAEMEALFHDIPEAMINSAELAKRCTVELILNKPQLPAFPIPEGMTIEEFFRAESYQGLEERIGAKTEENQHYWERLDTELNVINNMGFPGYFLIVADFIQWAKDNAIPVGPGRGSGAGSLVAWALKITDLDPLPYDLLFERFLNPERVSMPDFDVDFCMEGRDRVIEYVAHKYGREAVSQIATHGTMAAKAVIRDVGRALGHPYGFVDRIAKLIPMDLGITLEKALMQEPELFDLYKEDEEVKILIDFAKQLEGLSKSVGRHAGGVVIAPTKLTDFSPLYCEEGSAALVTQYDKDDIEAAGLVKFDFLGLRTLTIIDWALKNIEYNRGIKVDLHTMPLDDKATFQLLKACQTTSVFQLESRGMKDLLRRLQPDNFEDIIALVALFRPGPLESGMVEDFINRKHGREEVIYPFPELEPVLKPTYGVIVYQEQVMQISQIIGNYSLGGADLLRRAMGKKLPEEMEKQRSLFMAGAETLGFDAEKAGRLFDLMEKFAGYGFNKSHSAAYALLSYQTAYLKEHYPAEFMAAVLSADLDHTEKIIIIIDEVKEMKIPIIRPSVNESSYQFTVNQAGAIIYGLGALKGYGKAAALQLIEEREENGPYRDLFDFCRRVDLSKTSKRAIEILIRAGALDCLEPNLKTVSDRAAYRAQLLATMPEAIRLADQHRKNESSGQGDIFGLFDDMPAEEPQYSLQPAIPMSDNELLHDEKSVLGFFFTAHPVDQYRQEIEAMTTTSLTKLKEMPEPQYHSRAVDDSVMIGGLVTAFYTRISKAGNKLYFVVLDDGRSRAEIRLFEEMIQSFEAPIENDTILFIQGGYNWDSFNNAMTLRATALHSLESMRQRHAKYLMIENHKPISPQDLAQLFAQLTPYRDDNGLQLIFKYHSPDSAGILQLEEFRILPQETILTELKRNFYHNLRFTIGYGQ
ncbi:DNA polymerase III subunit alpha [Ignatzschineria larvae DSM 13226]|uniref:DNA polymerase III subunit alpha n=1 Tax=Ignatzschineria larvae DSM 13226 TaxID=1111732 RepID=A0ABZ3BXB3_9GAMM|nr:DNA polymerase III subunit alpha [Ignatzschineria larvae]